MAIDAENTAVILAALRYWQANGLTSSAPIMEIATNGGEYAMPDAAYIDDLCEALNCGDFNKDATADQTGLLGFVEGIARMTEYRWPEDDSWTDDQAEDALVCMNKLIEKARVLVAKEVSNAPV